MAAIMFKWNKNKICRSAYKNGQFTRTYSENIYGALKLYFHSSHSIKTSNDTVDVENVTKFIIFTIVKYSCYWWRIFEKNCSCLNQVCNNCFITKSMMNNIDIIILMASPLFSSNTSLYKPCASVAFLLKKPSHFKGVSSWLLFVLTLMTAIYFYLGVTQQQQQQH